MRLRVMLWDVRYGGDRKLPLLERVNADILLLLGVSRTSARKWSHRWQGRYHCAVGLDLTASPHQRPHGAMIAARWPFHDVAVIEQLPRPERGLAATVEVAGSALTLVSWGAPNSAGEGRPAKVGAYRDMSAWLSTLAGPVIVGVDTNSWFDPPSPDIPAEHDEAWAAEHGFLDRDGSHGLLDVHRALIDADPHRRRLLADLRPDGPLATTFIRRPHHQPRRIARGFDAGRDFGLDRMDRIFVSKQITPLACEHLYHEAIDLGGDHAAVVADLVVT